MTPKPKQKRQKIESMTNLPNELKEEWLKDFKDVQYMDLPIHESILEKQWDWITTHFHGSKPYEHDYVKNNQDIIAGKAHSK